MRFDLSGKPISAVEASALDADLAGLGVDQSLVRAYSRTVSRRSRLTRPLLLRGYSHDAFAGLAVVFVCRDSGRSLVASESLRRVIRAAPPIWYWERAGIGTDGHAGPGLVAGGIDRREFVDSAVSWLSDRFVMGTLVEDPAEERRAPFVRWTFPGFSTVAVDEETESALLGCHRNLARKVRRFAAHGGTIERVSGPLPTALRQRLARGYRIERPPDPPFRRHYPAMVSDHWSTDDPAMTHLIARLDGRAVGYHSFVTSGDTLCLQSGVFDRIDGGTAHAYENVLLAGIRLGVEQGCRAIEFGPATNEVKRSLLTTRSAELRFVSRWRPVRAGLEKLLPTSLLAR